MKDSKFRGKRKDNGEWIYGYLMDEDVICEGSYYDDYIDLNALNPVEVIPKTVSRYTGRKDKNNTEIYAGDIIKAELIDMMGYSAGEITGIVYYSSQWASYYVGEDMILFKDLRDIQVMGNTCDNPELLVAKRKL